MYCCICCISVYTRFQPECGNQIYNVVSNFILFFLVGNFFFVAIKLNIWNEIWYALGYTTVLDSDHVAHIFFFLLCVGKQLYTDCHGNEMWKIRCVFFSAFFLLFLLTRWSVYWISILVAVCYSIQVLHRVANNIYAYVFAFFFS